MRIAVKPFAIALRQKLTEDLYVAKRLLQIMARGIGELLQIVVRAPEVIFHTLPAGDIADDFRGSNDFAISVPDRRNRKRYVEEGPAFAAANRLELFDSFLSAPQPRQNLAVLHRAGLRHQHRDGLPYDFVGLVAEHPLGALVPAHDDAVQVLTDDGVIGRIHDRRQELDAALHTCAFGDVKEDAALRRRDSSPMCDAAMKPLSKERSSTRLSGRTKRSQCRGGWRRASASSSSVAAQQGQHRRR